MSRRQANAVLLLSALVWGIAFVPQSIVSPPIGAFAFMGSRFFSALRNKAKTYLVAIRQSLFGKPEQILDKKHEKSAFSAIFQPPKIETVKCVGYAKRRIFNF